MTTSFALSADDFAGPAAAPRAKAGFKAPKTALRTPFARNARAANTNKKTGGDSDGMLGSLILDGFLSAVFPGLGSVFNGISALDMVEMYDTFQSAVGPTAHEKQMRQQRALHIQPRPVSTMRQLLSIVFG